jgi:UDP-N-acetylglucosamine--N-acetylmuramyl-(pentapeptide) pyrophosphoryl-undecaprenol N-acetylglucosamine transferase
MKRIVIAGGGTGGHVFPAIAIADALCEHGVASEVIFIGTDKGLEARVVPQVGYPLETIHAEGFVGKSWTEKCSSIWTLLRSFAEARTILQRLRPQLVIGVGGYVSFSAVLAAYFRNIPILIHEQNAIPGLANRQLARFADTVAITYQESLSYFPAEKTVLTGNPVRKNLLKVDKRLARETFHLDPSRFTIFIFGGSAGARRINRAVTEALDLLIDLRDRVQFIHQTGDSDYEETIKKYRSLGFFGTVVPFVDKMAEAYAVADIVVCRAGATTLAEITAIGKAAVLIPYPYAAANHQERNARKLEDMGAARVIADRELNGMRLAELIRTLYVDDRQRSELERHAAAFGRLDAADRIVQCAKSLLRKG